MAKVLVTGGTGFVGSHSVAAILRKGHDVRMLVRSRRRVDRALEPLAVAPDDVVEGDVMDRDVVTTAMEGCDAVLHAANVFSFKPSHHATMREVNVDGSRLVFECAAAAGLSPIIHVSSTLALVPSDQPLSDSSPIGSPDPAYCRSKADGERVAREFQERGAPVIITNPGSVWGPHDPHFGESAGLGVSVLKGQMRVVNNGMMSVVDVRDVAEVHARLVDPRHVGRRFIVVGHNLLFHDLLDRLGTLTGRKLRPKGIPHSAAMALGKALDWVSTKTGAAMPIGYEPPWVIANNVKADSSATQEALGVSWRPLDDTLADTVRWLVESGRVSAKQAGNLAPVAT